MASGQSSSIQVTVNAAKEIFEVAKDYERPIEILREALHNSYDAGAKEASIVCTRERLADGSDVLSLEFSDDGVGMDREKLDHFFSLGFSDKETPPDRRPIGFKGHGTKIYYQAREVFVLTKWSGGDLLLAHLPDARIRVYNKELPAPAIYFAADAEENARKHNLIPPKGSGTRIRLIDYTPNSHRLIDIFQQFRMENYLRWFTIYGSFEHIVKEQKPMSPMRLFVQGTDKSSPSEVMFGHAWPEHDRTDIKSMKQKDERRPFNYFCKTLRAKDYPVSGGFRIDIAVLVEGARGRAERDTAIRLKGRHHALYREEERYGFWLCKDYLPVQLDMGAVSAEIRSLLDIEDSSRALIFVNCQDFALTANRGSVGNSSKDLLDAVKNATIEFLESQRNDPDLKKFSHEYREDMFSRLREKDKKALLRRIDRYNDKRYCTIQLPKGGTYSFFEPQREITLFGLISELRVAAPEILDLRILDYDDHNGIDLLVRRNGNPSDLLDKTRVAYTELKYMLTDQLNHPFESLYAIICWDCTLRLNDAVTDATDIRFSYYEHINEAEGVTYSQLTAPPGGRYSHNVKVIVLKRLLEQKYKLQMHSNPKPVGASAHGSDRGRKKKG